MAVDRPPSSAAAAVCGDDFDGEWVSTTVQSAVTHFFGNGDKDGDDDNEQEEEELRRVNAAPAAEGDGHGSDSEQASSHSLPVLNARPHSLSPSFPWDCLSPRIGDGNGIGIHTTAEVFPWPPPYFLPADFSSVAANVHYAGAVVTAAIVIHPIASLAATATAAASAWAVGSYYDLEGGYRIWGGEEFGSMFWAEEAQRPEGGEAGTALRDDYHNHFKVLVKVDKSDDEEVTSNREKAEGPLMAASAVTPQPPVSGDQRHQSPQRQQFYRLRRIKSAPSKALDNSKSYHNRSGSKGRSGELLASSARRPVDRRRKQPQVTVSTTALEHHYPPLCRRVVSVDLPGLDAAAFFRAFLSDAAPYGFRDFQRRRGDVDVRYGRWAAVGGRVSSLKRGQDGADPKPLPASSTQERTLTFSTLTKSYFGPAYAKAVKTQRATRLGANVLVVENTTQLLDIPFADRFRVIERWVVEAAKKNDDHAVAERMEDAPYTCRLTVHAEVEMLKSCSWEAQIRKKAYESLTEMSIEWCKSATVALEATEEQKRKRLRQDAAALLAPVLNSALPISPTDTNAMLLAQHRRNFRELDRLTAKGDLESCSVEVLHSPPSEGERRTVSVGRVLGEPWAANASESTSALGSADGKVTDESGRKAAVTMRGKSRKLFKRLSSRVSKSKPLPR